MNASELQAIVNLTERVKKLEWSLSLRESAWAAAEELDRQKSERIRELEEALSMCHYYAYDDSHGLDDDDALDRIRAIAYKALEPPR